MPVEMSRERFEELVRDALDQVPDHLLPGPSNFFPGRQRSGSQAKVYCCWESACHAAEGHEHCFAYLPWGCQGEYP